MKVKLIPCFLSSSTQLTDNLIRFKEIDFEYFMPKFGINIDAKCPTDFEEEMLFSESSDFGELFMSSEKKATDYWKKFAKTHLKRAEAFNEELHTDFQLLITNTSWGTFALLNDLFINVNVMRFLLILEA